MNKKCFIATAIAAVSLGSVAAQDGPTMGWSSWNTYGVNISEALIKRQADAMVSKGLKKAGFDHINIDDGYFGGRDKSDGHLLIHPQRFPNGLKGVVDHIHSRGLKAGIYSDAGRNTCGSKFNGDIIGRGVGLYEHDQQDADLFFKELGFDFIKVDFCGGSYYHNDDHLVLDEKERYNAIAKAIKNTGRDDVRMNACRWAYPGTWIDGAAFSWRTTGDIYDGWDSVKGIIAENLYLSAYSSKGHYNDMDMLEVGRSMNAEEDKTHFGMWCIMNSPLLIGCDLANIKSATLSLLKNTELTALNQDTLYMQAYVAALVNDCYILVKDIEKLNGKKRAFAVYNPGNTAKSVKVNFTTIDLTGKVHLRDVFKQKDLGEFTEQYETNIPAHGTRIYVAEAETRLERTRYEAETAYISDYQELKNNQDEKTGIYEYASFCSAGLKAGWLGYSEKNDLRWRDVFSATGGEYELTVGFICGENRNITVSVNGNKVNTLSVNSGGWQKVGTKTISIQLQKGRNEIRLSNPANWMPDIDYIDLKCTDQNAAIAPVFQDETKGLKAYSLQGQPVNAANAHGVVVQHGRKVLIK
ncbi:MAG: alpha-galactosidase [Prevotella sp.]|nr:alpha-galactosidase [Prevotella sp.]